MKPSNKWLNKILPMYREAVERFEFCRTFELDWSEEAITCYYEYESYGKGKSNIAPNNGCARGKFLIDLHVQMYREGIADQVDTKDELISDMPDKLKQYFDNAL